MMRVLGAAFLLAAIPAAAQTIETGSGDWSNIPELSQPARAAVDKDIVAAVAEAVDRGECKIPGQRRGNLDMKVPFLVHYRAGGPFDRVVIHSLGCARAETLLGGAVWHLLRQGAFQSAHAPHEGWYRGEVVVAHSDD
jgi:hypothetical protein